MHTPGASCFNVLGGGMWNASRDVRIDSLYFI